eukprot:jgi/Undpi1/7435/HiC_scaffold_22.g09908.m1
MSSSPPRASPPRRPRRADSTASAATAAAASVTLALACLLLLSAPGPADGFFRPSTRVKPPDGCEKSISALPRVRQSSNRPGRTSALFPQPQGQGASATGRPLPLLVMCGAEEEGGSGEQLQEEEEGEEEGMEMPSIDVPEMMSDEERTRLWVAVSRAEAKAVKLERQGEVEEAKELRAQANSMRYEDPYTTLQDQLDEAVKNEEFVKIARLRLQMGKIGVPPNAEMQARAEGKDPSSVAAETAKRMPGMSLRGSDKGSSSGTRGDGSTVSDGYSSKSVTTTHGIRVEVRSQYYPEQSNPLKDQYIFVYKVKITNHSSQTIQLVSRTWEIKAIEATEAPQLVKGPGVVGQQPVLEPGQSFEYSSACPITCAPKEGYQVLGRMKGSYLVVMGAVGEAAFEAKIDPFYLILPQAVLDERSGGGGGGGGGGGAGGGGGGMAGDNW